MFSLESPHRGDSNEYTRYTIFNMNKKDTINYPKSAAMGFFSKGLKNEFETAVVNEPSVFEPLKFYCIGFLENMDSSWYRYFFDPIYLYIEVAILPAAVSIELIYPGPVVQN